MWELDHKESWALKFDAFELWCWRRLLRVPWTARRSNQSILKEISPRSSLEGLMLKLKLLLPPNAKSWVIGKDPDAGKDWGQEEKGITEDEMVGWHHWLNGHGFGWTPGVGDGLGGLACCSSWGRNELNMTEWLNWTISSNKEQATIIQRQQGENQKQNFKNIFLNHHSQWSQPFPANFQPFTIQTHTNMRIILWLVDLKEIA